MAKKSLTNEIILVTLPEVVTPEVAPEFTLPEGWDMEMVEAHCASASLLDWEKTLKADGKGLLILPEGTKSTPENYIVPAGLMGTKERWFIKKNLSAHTIGEDGQITIVASLRQLKDRGITL